MKILLIDPPTSEITLSLGDFSMHEPLSIEYVAAGVSDKHDVRILDMRLDKSLEKHLAEFAPDIVGLTSYTIQVYITRDLCKKIKAFNPNILTVVGGHHATMAAGDFFDPNIDVIVRGEGVFTFREIVAGFEKKQDLCAVKGIAFARNNELIITEPRVHPDLDSFPFPARSLTEQYREKYTYFTESQELKPFATIQASRGCPYRCKFCAVWKFTDGKYLPRDPHAILEEIKIIKEDYIDLADDEAFVDKKKMDKLADLIIDSAIEKSFFTHARANTIVNNPELFEKWKEAGLKRIFIGIESNRAKDLEYFRKQNTISINEKAVSILKNLGIKFDASFIITPDYDIEDFDKLAEYTQNLGADVVVITPLTPLPGTDLYDELKDQITTSNLELFDLGHAVLPTKLPLEKFYREYYYLMFRANKYTLEKNFLNARFNQPFSEHLSRLRKALRNRHLHHQAAGGMSK